MSCSTVSGGVVGDGAWGSAELVVESDGGGEGEEALADAGSESVEGSGAVSFECEQVFAGPEDRFDSLSDGGQAQPGLGFVFAGWPGDERVEDGGVVFELAAGVAFVADHGQGAVALDAAEQLQADVTLGCLGGGECERSGGAVQAEQAVQSEAPEEAAVALTPAVVGGVGELASAGRSTLRAHSTGVESTSTRLSL